MDSETSYTLAKKILAIASFFAPFFIIFPTNLGIYELLLLLSFSLFIYSGKENKKVGVNSTQMYFFIGLLLLATGYLISSIPAEDTLEALKFPAQALIISFQALLLFLLVDTEEDLRNHAVALTGSSVAISAYYMLGRILQLDIYSGSGRLELFYGSPNALAIILVVILPLSILLSVQFRESKSIFTAFLLQSVIILYLIIQTLSRAALISSFMILLLLLMTNFTLSYPTRMQLVTRGTLGASVGILFVIGLLVGFVPSQPLERFYQTLTGERSIGRIDLFYHAMGDIIQSPLLGVGYNHYQIDGSSSHNIILSPFTEGGLIAGIGVIIIISYLLINFKNICFDKSSYPGPVKLSFIYSSLGYILVSTFMNLYVLRYVWLVIILGYVSIEYSAQGTDF